MKKKVFVMGKVYNLGTLGVNEVENEVQADLDKVFNAGGVRFLLREVSGKTLELTFFRKYRKGEIDWLNYDPKLIYNIDANIITGHSFNGFRITGEAFLSGTRFPCRRENSRGVIRIRLYYLGRIR